MQIGAALGAVRTRPRRAPREDVLEEIAECGRRAHRSAEPEKSNPAKPYAVASSDDAAAVAGVIASTAVGIDQRFVRVQDLPKSRRRLAIPGIDVRVISTRETTVRPLDLAGRRRALHSEDDVEIHLVKQFKFKVQSEDLVLSSELRSGVRARNVNSSMPKLPTLQL